MYLIKGDETYFINEKLNEIIKELSKNNEEIEIINFIDFFSLEELSDALSNSSLFDDKRIIVIKNPFIFNSKNKNTTDEEIKSFIDLIKNNLIEDNNVNLIFSQEIYKYDREFLASKAFYYINKNSEVIEVKKIEEKNLFSYVFSMIKKQGGYISDAALLLFLEVLPNNLELINQEIKKLLLINKNITKEAVQNSVFSMSNNIDFALSESILEWGDKKSILSKLNEQLQYDFGISQIISQLANVFLITKSIHILKKRSLSNEEISKIINIHPYRIKLHFDFLTRIGISKLNSLISEISNIDIDFKKGIITEEYGIDLVILSLFK